MYLRGPVCFGYYTSDKFPLKIYVVGDEHQKKMYCETVGTKDKITIPQWLQELSQERTVDLFFESEEPKLRQSEDSIPNFLLDTEKFADKESKKKQSNLRVHFADIREGNSYRDDVLRKLDNVYWATKDYLAHSTHENRQLLKAAIDSVFPIRLAHIMRVTKLIRQLDFIEDAKVKHQISECFGRKLRENLPVAPKLDDIISVQQFWYILRKFTCALMDFYVMCRVFRKFKDGTKPKDVVLYFGKTHIDAYVQFLKTLGFRQHFYVTSQTTGKSYQCVLISKYRPWFP